MQSKDSKFWEERLRNFESTSVELREKAMQLEEEIKGIEGSLYHKNITAYRTSLLERAKKAFIKAFKQRDDLPPEPEIKEEWEELTNLMSACITVIKSIDTEEAAVCSSVEDLRNYLKNEIEAVTEDSGGQIAALLKT